MKLREEHPKMRVLLSLAVLLLAATPGVGEAGKPKLEYQGEPIHYTSVDDIKLDGNAAFGKLVQLRMLRGNTEDTSFSAMPCGDSPGMESFQLTFVAEQRTQVRAMPTDFMKRCPTVLFRLLGQGDFGELSGKLIAINGVSSGAPAAAAIGDTGDYKSFDDIKLDGAKAFGRQAKLAMWRGNTETTSFTAYPCGEAGGVTWMEVKFRQDQRDAVKKVPTDAFKGCRMLTVTIVGKSEMDELVGELVEVGKTVASF